MGAVVDSWLTGRRGAVVVGIELCVSGLYTADR